LEVGTGFHQELTGRENIYLNGAILGMSRAEIGGKFDEIVAFSGVEKFLETPVKRYSSGMYVRLAFAVAAHLEPEVLVVDEVLAVGDAEFQKKCIGKMSEVASGGRTVLFVSHNMVSISSLCTVGALLSDGRLLEHGAVEEVIARYSNGIGENHSVCFAHRPDLPTITAVGLDEAALKRGDLRISIEFRSPFPLRPPIPGIVVSTAAGAPVFASNPRFHKSCYSSKEAAAGTIDLEVCKLPIVPGIYRLSVWLGDWSRDYDAKNDVLQFKFLQGLGIPTRPSAAVTGALDWPAHWRLREHT
jgi:lipopolysaccharide transport system ATP-binding protein